VSDSFIVITGNGRLGAAFGAPPTRELVQCGAQRHGVCLCPPRSARAGSGIHACFSRRRPAFRTRARRQTAHAGDHDDDQRERSDG
jgi:hypothetical protein